MATIEQVTPDDFGGKESIMKEGIPEVIKYILIAKSSLIMRTQVEDNSDTKKELESVFKLLSDASGKLRKIEDRGN